MQFETPPQRVHARRPQDTLPNILDMQIRRIPYRAPRLRYFESYLAKYTQAIEFLIKTDGPFAVRALSPALYVGDVAVSEFEGVENNTYRFLAFEFDQLKDGDSISLGWLGQVQEQRQRTIFHYKSPDGDSSKA